MQRRAAIALLFSVSVILLVYVVSRATARLYVAREPVAGLDYGPEQARFLWLLVVASWGAVLLSAWWREHSPAVIGVLGVALVGIWWLAIPKSVFGLLMLAVAAMIALLSWFLLGVSGARSGRTSHRGLGMALRFLLVLFPLTGLALYAMHWAGELLFMEMGSLSGPLWATPGGQAAHNWALFPGPTTVDTVWRGGVLPLVVLFAIVVARFATNFGTYNLIFALAPILVQIPNPPDRLFPWVAALESFVFGVWVLYSGGMLRRRG